MVDKPRFRIDQAAKRDEAFAARLRLALQHRDQLWLSRQTGIPSSTIGEHARGLIPRADKALIIADTLGVPLRWLISGVEEPAGINQLDEDDWISVPMYSLSALSGDGVPAEEAKMEMFNVPLHRDWLTRAASAEKNLWCTFMPASALDDAPSEGDMIVCCDAAQPHGEGLYLYRYHDVPVVRRFIAQGATAPGVMDVTMFGVPSMELLGRVLGAIKMQPAG